MSKNYGAVVLGFATALFAGFFMIQPTATTGVSSRLSNGLTGLVPNSETQTLLIASTFFYGGVITFLGAISKLRFLCKKAIISLGNSLSSLLLLVGGVSLALAATLALSLLSPKINLEVALPNFWGWIISSVVLSGSCVVIAFSVASITFKLAEWYDSNDKNYRYGVAGVGMCVLVVLSIFSGII